MEKGQLVEGGVRSGKEEGERIVGALENRDQEFDATDVAALDDEQYLEYLRGAVNGLQESFDGENAGFGGAPKFPPSLVLEFLLRLTSDTWACLLYPSPSPRD